MAALALGQPLDILSPIGAFGSTFRFLVARGVLSQRDPIVSVGVGLLDVVAHWSVEQRFHELAGTVVASYPRLFEGSLSVWAGEVAVVDSSGVFDQPRHESVVGLDVLETHESRPVLFAQRVQ